jgi:ComF family protein
MQTIVAFESILRSVGAMVFPARCPTCGASGEPVCNACAASMRPAVSVPPPANVAYWVAPFAYEHTARELIARIKYRNERHALDWLADRAWIEFERQTPTLRSQLQRGTVVVTWAPTTTQHRRDRGFDHAELIARAVARKLGTRPVALLKRVDKQAQTGQSREGRMRGPEFAVNASVHRISWRNVIICDDVATTGSTLRNAASVLRRQLGVDEVSAITLARTPPRGSR